MFSEVKLCNEWVKKCSHLDEERACETHCTLTSESTSLCVRVCVCKVPKHIAQNLVMIFIVLVMIFIGVSNNLVI